MTANGTTLAVLAATLCGHQLVLPSDALAGPREATIEVVRQAPGGGKQTMSFTLAVGEDRRPSRLKVNSDGTFYRISISHEKHKDNTAVVHLDLRCDEHRAAATRRWRLKQRGAGRSRVSSRRGRSTSTDVSLSSRITLGKRTLLGRLSPTSGGEMRIAVTLR